MAITSTRAVVCVALEATLRSGDVRKGGQASAGKGRVGHDLEVIAGVGASTTEIVFRDVRVPTSNRLADESEGFQIAQARLASAESTTPCVQLAWPSELSPRIHSLGSTEPTPHGRDQIRDQDATGRSSTGRDGGDVAAVVTATNGDGGDGSGGLGLGSLCS
jgi:hypothetical protein